MPMARAQQTNKKKTQAPSGYYLPRAGFPVLTRSSDSGVSGVSSLDSANPGGNDLPTVNGLHLLDGMDRRPGEAGQAYDPGEESLNMAHIRWNQSRFPLRVWISEGKALPEVPFSMTKDDRLRRIQIMLHNPASFDELPTCQGWKPGMNDAVANGIEEWDDMKHEGVVNFGFVDRPQDADIVVFFTKGFPGAAGPGGTDVKALTMGMAFTPADVQHHIAQGHRGVPVVMELKVNEDTSRLQGDAAHEFGHALGIKAHSPYRQDIMYENRMVDVPSPADKATLRALYKSTPQYWYY